MGRTIDPAINDVAGFRPAAAFALLLAFALAGATPVRATDTEAAEPELAQPVVHVHRKPLARDPAAAFAKRLDLDANQQAQVRGLLAIRQAQIRSVWSDPEIAGDDRVGAIKALNAKTVEQIRSLLTEEQKQKYFQPRPVGSVPPEPGPGVEEWLRALRPQNLDAGTPN